jgi:hypothetical protein
MASTVSSADGASPVGYTPGTPDRYPLHTDPEREMILQDQSKNYMRPKSHRDSSITAAFPRKVFEKRIGAQRILERIEPKKGTIRFLLLVRSDLLRICEQLLEIRTVTDRIPDRVNLQTSDGSYVARRDRE